MQESASTRTYTDNIRRIAVAFAKVLRAFVKALWAWAWVLLPVAFVSALLLVRH